jgi:hypothetical protein
MNTDKNTTSTTIKKFGGLACVLVIALLCFSILFTFSGLQSVYGLGVFSKDEKPFGKSYDDWASEYWNKWIGKNTDQATPRPGGCLVVNNDYKSESMVMLMETADVNFPPAQSCQISSNQGIIIPLWIGWGNWGCPSGQNLTQCARQQNLGNIASDVKVDGMPIAKLDVRQSLNPVSRTLEYKINSLTNVIQSTSKEFTLTIPPDTHKPNQIPGTGKAVSDGWWVFLKPLPPGTHTISYNIRVTPTGAITSPGTNPHFADITYNFQVVK